jgi:hypothetical protein
MFRADAFKATRGSNMALCMKTMHVELALFDGEVLLERGRIDVGVESSCYHLKHFHIAHRLEGDAAKVVLSSFSSGINLKTVTLDMPVHQSADWESIGLADYTLAFRCSLTAQQSAQPDRREDAAPG